MAEMLNVLGVSSVFKFDKNTFESGVHVKIRESDACVPQMQLHGALGFLCVQFESCCLGGPLRIIYLFIIFKYLFLREREPEGQREGDRRSEAGSSLTAESLMQGSSLQMVRL